MLFGEQSATAIVDAVREFERNETHIRPEACRANARRFAPDRFRAQFADFVAACTRGDVPCMVAR